MSEIKPSKIFTVQYKTLKYFFGRQHHHTLKANDNIHDIARIRIRLCSDFILFITGKKNIDKFHFAVANFTLQSKPSFMINALPVPVVLVLFCFTISQHN